MTASENQLRSNIVMLLNQVGDQSKCKRCGTMIWWMESKSGKSAAYNCEGQYHFSECPMAGGCEPSTPPAPALDRKSLAAGEEQERLL